MAATKVTPKQRRSSQAPITAWRIISQVNEDGSGYVEVTHDGKTTIHYFISDPE